jgi:hypothetical protein
MVNALGPEEIDLPSIQFLGVQRLIWLLQIRAKIFLRNLIQHKDKYPSFSAKGTCANCAQPLAGQCFFIILPFSPFARESGRELDRPARPKENSGHRQCAQLILTNN